MFLQGTKAPELPVHTTVDNRGMTKRWQRHREWSRDSGTTAIRLVLSHGLVAKVNAVVIECLVQDWEPCDANHLFILCAYPLEALLAERGSFGQGNGGISWQRIGPIVLAIARLLLINKQVHNGYIERSPRIALRKLSVEQSSSTSVQINERRSHVHQEARPIGSKRCRSCNATRSLIPDALALCLWRASPSCCDATQKQTRRTTYSKCHQH
eukprot:5730914-Amphidinium_carterae.2